MLLAQERWAVIIVRVMGGLGNQMFQYALGRRLSLNRGVPLKLDISFYQTDLLRRYELDHYKIQAEISRPEEVERFVSLKFSNRLWRRLQRQFVPIRYRNWVKEPTYGFHAEVLQVRGTCYLDGYWQSPLYFDSIEAQLRQEFSLREPVSAESASIRETIEQSQSISVHIRRGDYVTDPQVSRVHGTVSHDYYRTALEMIRRFVDHPHFFVFSDDPDWVHLNFKPAGEVTYVTRKESSPAHEDLYLMSLCQHHIIANSSFSWWGAWLSTNTDKRVIAPSRWGNLSALNTSDRFLSDWIIVES
jgi:hypothetical protein